MMGGPGFNVLFVRSMEMFQREKRTKNKHDSNSITKRFVDAFLILFPFILFDSIKNLLAQQPTHHL